MVNEIQLSWFSPKEVLLNDRNAIVVSKTRGSAKERPGGAMAPRRSAPLPESEELLFSGIFKQF